MVTSLIGGGGRRNTEKGNPAVLLFSHIIHN